MCIGGSKLADNKFPRGPPKEAYLRRLKPESFTCIPYKQTAMRIIIYLPFEFDSNSDEAFLLEQDSASLGEILLPRLFDVMNTLSPLQDNYDMWHKISAELQLVVLCIICEMLCYAINW